MQCRVATETGLAESMKCPGYPEKARYYASLMPRYAKRLWQVSCCIPEQLTTVCG
jgi:hypothetical protein